MKNGERFRLKTMAKYAHGRVLDIWYNNLPNPFLQNADGLDMTVESKPENYVNFYKLPETLLYPIEDNVYDSILAWEVIEHVLNLEIFFWEIGRVLKKDWILIISTPNPLFYSYYIMTMFNLFYKGWVRWDHVHLFCNGDIQTLANIFGYELVEVKAAYWQFLNFQIPLPWNWMKFFSFQNIYILKKK
jgi:SAM-dependent methyltransferase